MVDLFFRVLGFLAAASSAGVAAVIGVARARCKRLLCSLTDSYFLASRPSSQLLLTTVIFDLDTTDCCTCKLIYGVLFTRRAKYDPPLLIPVYE